MISKIRKSGYRMATKEILRVESLCNSPDS
nr:MAG TPA: putative membrane protein [Caudoviricetes sp.]